jgi:hypothetical protein
MEIVWLEGFGKLKKKINDLIGIRTSNLPACSLASQSTTVTKRLFTEEGKQLQMFMQ